MSRSPKEVVVGILQTQGPWISALLIGCSVCYSHSQGSILVNKYYNSLMMGIQHFFIRIQFLKLVDLNPVGILDKHLNSPCLTNA